MRPVHKNKDKKRKTKNLKTKNESSNGTKHESGKIRERGLLTLKTKE
jgi:hypothetical protein